MSTTEKGLRLKTSTVIRSTKKCLHQKMSTVKNGLHKKYSITLDKIKRCLKNLVPYGIKKEDGNSKQAVVKRILLKSRMRTTFQVE